MDTSQAGGHEWSWEMAAGRNRGRPGEEGSVEIAKQKNPVQMALSGLGLGLFAYMLYATLYNPFATRVQHLALYLLGVLIIYFLKDIGNPERSRKLQILDMVLAAASAVTLIYHMANFDRIVNSWGAMFLTNADLVAAGVLALLILEAARRQSLSFVLLSVACILYIIFGAQLPGILGHPGMDLRRFLYLTAYTSEGVFGVGLEVAVSYLFMFILLSSAMEKTKTGEFIIGLCNAGFGHRAGGPAKSSVVASGALGSFVGSPIGNVVTTGTFTIPLMKRTGYPAHKAGAIETVSSEGAQILPPVMGAGAFLMAEFTGIPYATIALAATIPALLYFVSVFTVVHIEARRMGLTGLDRSELPSAREVFRDGWHLLVAPLLLLYLLLVEKFTPAYAGMICLGAAVAVAMLRKTSRLNLRGLFEMVDDGVRRAAVITALLTSIGFIQQAMVTTGLGPRLTEVILVFSDGSMLVTLLLAVVVATLVSMGTPASVSYVLLALFVAPALTTSGVSLLGAHLFLFYFAIKSGSTPPVAVVAVVAAAIAEANWWKTAVTAFLYSIPGFLIAFQFAYNPALLFDGSWFDIVLSTGSALIGVIAIAAGLQGWCSHMLFGPLGWLLRVMLIGGAFLLVQHGLITDILGLAMTVGVFLLTRALQPRYPVTLEELARERQAARALKT